MSDKDTIYRQAAIDAFEKELSAKYNRNWRERAIGFVGAKRILENLPSAEQWIPCGETIDIPDREVLCCDKRGEELIGWLSCNDDHWFCESNGEIMYDTIAWCEKPEPWKGEKDETG